MAHIDLRDHTAPGDESGIVHIQITISGSLNTLSALPDALVAAEGEITNPAAWAVVIGVIDALDQHPAVAARIAARRAEADEKKAAAREEARKRRDAERQQKAGGQQPPANGQEQPPAVDQQQAGHGDKPKKSGKG